MAPPINKPKPEPWYPPGFVPPKPKVAADPEAKAAHANAPTERAAPAMTLEQRNKAFMADVASRSAVVEANKPFGAAKPATSFADLREPSVIRESYLNKPEAAKPMVSIGPDAQSRARAEATAHAPSKSAGAQSHDGHKPERVADAGARKPHVHVHPPVQPRSAFGEQLHAEAKEITRANGVVRSALAQDLHPDAIKAVVENRLHGHAKDVAMKMLDGANDKGTMAERLADSQKVASVLQATAAKARDPEHAQELVSAKLKGDMASSAGAIVANLANHSHTKEQGSQLNAERLASTLAAGSASGTSGATVNKGMSASMSHGASATDSIGVGISASVSESVKTAAQTSFGATSSSSATSGFSEGTQASVGPSLASSTAMLSGHSGGMSEGSSHSASTQTSNSDGFSASLGAVLAGSSSMSQSTGHSESMAANFVSEGMSSGSSRSASESHSGPTTESGNLLSEVRSNTEVYSDGSSVTQRSSTVSWSDAEGVHSHSRSETITQAAEHGGSGVGGAKGLAGLDMGGSSISTNAGMSSSSSESMSSGQSISRGEGLASTDMGGGSSSKSAGMSSSSSESMSSDQGVSRGDGAKTADMVSSTDMGSTSHKSTLGAMSSESVTASHSKSEGTSASISAGDSHKSTLGAMSSESVTSSRSMSEGTSASISASDSHKSALGAMSSESVTASHSKSEGTSASISASDSHKSALGAMSSESVSVGRENGEAQSARMAMSDAEASREVKTFNIEASKSEGVAHATAEGSSQARSSVPIEERSTFASAEPSRAVPVEERSTFAEPGQHLASPGQSFLQNAVSSVVSRLPDSVAEVAQNGLEKAQAAFTSASEKVADTIHAAASAGSRVSLEDALAAHMRDKGFDAESIAAAGAIADAIRSESPDVKAESVIVLHRAGANGEPLATVVHAKDAASAAMAGDSVLALDTLDKIASQGMDSKSVSQLRSGMPEAVAGQSDLELAQITGPAKTALGGELSQAQEQTRQQEQNAQREAKQAESAQGREMAMAMQ